MLQPTDPGVAAKPRWFEPRMAVIYFTTIAANGLFLPFFPLWLEAVRFDAPTIAFVLAVPMFARVVSVLVISAYADKSRDRAGLLVLCVAATFVVSLGYLLPPTYAGVLAVSLLLSVVWPVQSTLCDSIALSGVRRFGADYSRMRVWGSIGYLATNLAGGVLLGVLSAHAVPALFSAAMGLALASALFAPRLGAPRARVVSDDGVPLRRQRYFLLFVSAAGLIQSSHAMFYSFSAIYWRSLGLSDATVGALWAFAVVSEVMVFAVFRPVFGRVPVLGILYAAALAAALRWTLTPLVWPWGLGVPGFFAVQALHSLSTGLMIIGVQKMIAQTLPDHQTGGAQGIAYFVSNTALALVTLGSGVLYERFGAHGFFAMTAVALGGLALALAARAAQPQRARSGGWTREPS